MLKNLALAALAFTSLSAVASPIAGVWNGPCETRGNLSVRFDYNFSEADADNKGSLAKTKYYFSDANCQVYSRTGRATVPYVFAGPDADGIYTLDVNHRGTMFYDIFALSEDGLTLSFGDDTTADATGRPTALSTTYRVFQKAAQ